MRHIHERARRVAAGAHLVLAVLALAACGGDLAAPATLAPSGSTAASTQVASTGPTSSSSTVAVATTLPVAASVAAPTTSSVMVTAPPPASTYPLGMQNPNVSDTVLSAEGPWQLVDAAPGVTQPGLVYQLRPEVWVYLPLQEDFAHNILWTFHEIDREVVEGYLRAQADRLPADAGLVLRPQVLGDERSDTTALVADCVLPTDGGPAHGEGFSLVLRGGDWVVVSAYPRDDACW